MPVENWGISIVPMGEGRHNYHHTFPRDYKASESGIPIKITTSLLLGYTVTNPYPVLKRILGGIHHITGCATIPAVNSFAHLWGNKQYDNYIMPVENWGVSIVAVGEGRHNYHHRFPCDYKASESGIPIKITTSLLLGYTVSNLCAVLERILGGIRHITGFATIPAESEFYLVGQQFRTFMRKQAV